MLSLIVPVYKNEGGIDALVTAVEKLETSLSEPLEAVFVVDGSPDASHAQLEAALVQSSLRAQLLLLSRNFGSFAAIRCGLGSALGDKFAVMAADLQEPPELVLEMQQLLDTKKVDVVVGRRTGRADARTARWASRAFWALYRRLVIPDIPPGGVDMFACNTAVRDALLRLEEHNSSLVAQLFWVGYRRAEVPYQRRGREIGVSAWTLRRKVKYLADSIFSFSDLPLRVLLTTGVAVSFVAGLFAAVILFQRWFGLISVSGYAATVLSIILFGALNLTATGLVGAYAWRTYENSKNRPLHLVMTQRSYLPSDEDANG